MPTLKEPTVPQELILAGAALKVGIIEALKEKPVTAEELAKKLSLDFRAVSTVMEALLSLGYVERENKVLKLTPDVEKIFFDENDEKYIGYSLIHAFNVIKAWTNLPEVLKTGQPPKRERNSQDIKGFMAAMKKNAKTVSEQLVCICLRGLPKGARVLDLGGGPLNYARPFARTGAEVIVQDVPEVCAVMETTILPGEKIKFTPGDFTESVYSGSFDLAFLGNICHIYGEDGNRLLFKRVYSSLRAGGRIAILDFVRGISPRGELFAVNMLVNTKTGGTWTMEQYTKWLTEAGFGQVEMKSVKDQQVILATRQ